MIYEMDERYQREIKYICLLSPHERRRYLDCVCNRSYRYTFPGGEFVRREDTVELWHIDFDQRRLIGRLSLLDSKPHYWELKAVRAMIKDTWLHETPVENTEFLVRDLRKIISPRLVENILEEEEKKREKEQV